MRRSPRVTFGRTALTASFSVPVEQLTVVGAGDAGGAQKKSWSGLLSWLMGVWLTGLWLTGAFAANIGCSDSWLIGELTGLWLTGSAPMRDWLIGVWLTGVWLTGVPY